MNIKVQLSAFLFSTVLLLTAISAAAQTSISGEEGEDCRIRYSYDAAGNRVVREYRCITPGPGGSNPDILDPGPVISVSPNPTSGVINVVFSEEVAEAYFVISASDGRHVLSYELMQPAQNLTFDISPEVPGAYFLTVWALNREETHKIIKEQ